MLYYTLQPAEIFNLNVSYAKINGLLNNKYIYNEQFSAHKPNLAPEKVKTINTPT